MAKKSIGEKIAEIYGAKPVTKEHRFGPTPRIVDDDLKPGRVVSVVWPSIKPRSSPPPPKPTPNPAFQHMGSSFLEGLDEESLSDLMESMREESEALYGKSVHSVFYFTGLGGHLRVGLGEALADLGVSFTGLEFRGSFLELHRAQQLEMFSEKLRQFESQGGRKLIAVSAGGGLTLQYLLQHKHPDLDVLLLSPALGGLRAEWRRCNDQICKSLRLVTGTYDPVCSIELARDFVAQHEYVSFNLVAGAGHDLPHREVRSELESFLSDVVKETSV